MTPEQTNIVNNLATQWFDLIAIRNDAPYGSPRYNLAERKADEIENRASMIVFGDTDHTMSECLDGESAE
jgi:hypothetical protein